MAKPKVSLHCHYEVAELAQSMAHEVYDALMLRNEWYDRWKALHPNMAGNSKALEAAFVRLTWPKLIEEARATLAGMLSRPYDEGLKERIYEALILDSQLVRGRKKPKMLMGAL